MCASKGWSVEASARTAIFAPRRLRCRALARRRRVVRADGMKLVNFYYNTELEASACALAAFGDICGSNGKPSESGITEAAGTCARIRLSAKARDRLRAGHRAPNRTLPESARNRCRRSRWQR